MAFDMGRTQKWGQVKIGENLDEQLTNVANVSGIPQLLVDFAEVSIMGSSGLGTLMAAHTLITRRGGQLAVINVGDNIKNLIIRSRLISTLGHFDSEDEPIAALKADHD